MSCVCEGRTVMQQRLTAVNRVLVMVMAGRSWVSVTSRLGSVFVKTTPLETTVTRACQGWKETRGL